MPTGPRAPPRPNPWWGFPLGDPRGTRNLSFSGHQTERKICCQYTFSLNFCPGRPCPGLFLSRNRTPAHRYAANPRGRHYGIRKNWRRK